MKTYKYTTNHRTILGDLFTPVSTYMKVRDLYPQSALMESSDYHSHDTSRSFIALNPIANIGVAHGKSTATFPDGTQEVKDISDEYKVEQATGDFLSAFAIEGEQRAYCGLYGYTSFNAVRYFEHIAVKDCTQKRNDAPDMLYILYKYVIVFDHFNNMVDLARNDLSRNCHGVRVDFYKDMQYYSHVIHLVSRVSGELDEGADPVKAFIDTSPAGTLSGAPKVRAMQLISELEPHNRGAYGGCIGFLGLDGSLNQAITIRTFVSRNNELWFQAGGGIVAKSNEEYELQEVNNKLGALRRAILLAEKM